MRKVNSPEDHYFMNVALVVSSKAKCHRRKVGAVLVKDRKILATGYNGAPAGVTNCTDIECLRTHLKVPSGEKFELCRGLHAEKNALLQCPNTQGTTLYCIYKPCSECTKAIINAGVIEIVYLKPYHSPLAKELLAETGIVVRQLKHLDLINIEDLYNNL